MVCGAAYITTCKATSKNKKTKTNKKTREKMIESETEMLVLGSEPAWNRTKKIFKLSIRVVKDATDYMEPKRVKILKKIIEDSTY